MINKDIIVEHEGNLIIKEKVFSCKLPLKNKKSEQVQFLPQNSSSSCKHVFKN